MNTNLTTIARFDNSANANLSLGLLQASGIEAVLADEAILGMAWHMSPALGGIRLQVRQEDEEKARSVLEDQGTDPDSQEKNFPEGFFEEKELTPEEIQNQKKQALANRAFKAGIIGMGIGPLLLYSLVLCGKAWSSEGSISGGDKLKLASISILTPVMIVGYVVLYSRLF